MFRDKSGHSQAVTPARSRAYKYQIQAAVKAAITQFGWVKTDSPVSVRCIFHRAGIRKADVDNLAKAQLDGCNGLLWTDDNQVHCLEVYKFHRAQVPRCTVLVRELSSDWADFDPAIYL